MGFKKSYLGSFYLGLFLLGSCHASTLKHRPKTPVYLESRGVFSGSTSPTISVQRFGGSTFYSYVKFDSTTEASLVSSSLKDEESVTVSSVAPTVSTTIDNSPIHRSDDEESNEDVVSVGREDDAVNTDTTAMPASDLGEDGGTENSPPASSADTSGSGGGSGSDGAESAPSVPEADGDSNDGGNGNDGNVPSDQTPPPDAEAVPGQPGEDDPDSSSSSSSSEDSSSSSSEEYKQAFKKVWEHNKVKSKGPFILTALQGKLMKKEKPNKYSFY